MPDQATPQERYTRAVEYGYEIHDMNQHSVTLRHPNGRTYALLAEGEQPLARHSVYELLDFDDARAEKYGYKRVSDFRVDKPAYFNPETRLYIRTTVVKGLYQVCTSWRRDIFDEYFTEIMD